jgi:hypothetical protein
MRTCGDCLFWERAKPYAWGKCHCPIPMHLADFEDPIIEAKKDAKDCEAFKEKDGRNESR